MGGMPPEIVSHPIRFGSGVWTCVIGEFEDRDGAIAEEYIWA